MSTFLLEPLSCLLRLAMLQFMPEGTKLGIHRSRIYIVDPWTLQPLVRWYMGSSRDDLFFLLRPVVAAKMRFNQKDEDLKRIMLHASMGLRALQRTYAKEANVAGQCLKLYSQYLTGEAEIDEEDFATDDFATQIYGEYRKIWSKKELAIARGILDMARSDNCNSRSWVRALGEILNSKEAAAQKILTSLTEGITKNNTDTSKQTLSSATK